ncbi:alpha/beta hydrolase [Candidatus Puniceispirillum sp.]|nr:alpha/beta hydrolase [Candidatus Puniceispirillum sp.]
MFDWALAAGLPMLGGYDVYAHYHNSSVRAHVWVAEEQAHDSDEKYKMRDSITLSSDFQKTIVIFPGFTEFCEKYSAEVLRFHERGFNVLIIDWPGQGQSGHFGSHPLAVHCDDFDHHIGAMDAVIEKAGLDDHELILFGHSMGGHLALRYAAWRPCKVKAVILIAPMMAPPVMPVWLVRAASHLLLSIGFARMHVPFYHVLSLDVLRKYRVENPLTRDPKGYESQFFWFDDVPELRRSGPSIGWINAAYRSCALYTLNSDWLAALEVPVLAFVAGDERIVFSAATDSSLPHIKNLTRVDFKWARHELMRELPEVNAEIWQNIDNFLERLDHEFYYETAFSH